MSAHKARIVWHRETESFAYPDYNRNHEWCFEGQTIAASAAVAYLGQPDRVDPEEALVASVSACHMLTFLAVASRKGFVIDSYEDAATGILSKNAAGRLAITRVTLQPTIVFGGDKKPDATAVERMHNLSHNECFIANTVNCEIVVDSQDG